MTTRRVSLPVPRVEVRVVPAKKSRDDDDVSIRGGVVSPADIRLTMENLHQDEDTERQLYSRLSDF